MAVDVSHLPRRIVFVDVETTGLTGADRVVSLGAIALDRDRIRIDAPAVETLHLVFNPGRPSHAMARAVHGYSDEHLALHEPFAMRAAEIGRFVASGDCIVAHNAAFDLRFIGDELRRAGQPARLPPSHCTMQAHRLRHGGGGSLDTVARHHGLARQGARHGAMEDAWLAMLIFLRQHDVMLATAYPDAAIGRPANARAMPRRS